MDHGQKFRFLLLYNFLAHAGEICLPYVAGSILIILFSILLKSMPQNKCVRHVVLSFESILS